MAKGSRTQVSLKEVGIELVKRAKELGIQPFSKNIKALDIAAGDSLSIARLKAKVERATTIAGRAELIGIEFGDTVKAQDDGRTWRVLQIGGGPRGSVSLGDPALTGKAREIRSMKDLLQLTVVKKFDGKRFLRAFDKAFEDAEKSKVFKSSVILGPLVAEKARRRPRMGK